MALVNIIRCGGSDIYDLQKHLASAPMPPSSAPEVDADTNTAADATGEPNMSFDKLNNMINVNEIDAHNIHDRNIAVDSIDISLEGEIGDLDITLNPMYPTPVEAALDQNAYCIDCTDMGAADELESLRIVPVQDTTGALPFNQLGTVFTLQTKGSVLFILMVYLSLHHSLLSSRFLNKSS